MSRQAAAVARALARATRFDNPDYRNGAACRPPRRASIRWVDTSGDGGRWALTIAAPEGGFPFFSTVCTNACHTGHPPPMGFPLRDGATRGAGRRGHHRSAPRPKPGRMGLRGTSATVRRHVQLATAKRGPLGLVLVLGSIPSSRWRKAPSRTIPGSPGRFLKGRGFPQFQNPEAQRAGICCGVRLGSLLALRWPSEGSLKRGPAASVLAHHPLPTRRG
jgi:hypothetical protein